MSSKKREGYEECMANIISLANRGGTAPITSSFVDTTMHDVPVSPEEKEVAAQGA